MYTNYGQDMLAKAHRYELMREAERERLADSCPRRPNLAQQAANKLGLLLMGLGTRMKRVEIERVMQRPEHITGDL